MAELAQLYFICKAYLRLGAIAVAMFTEQDDLGESPTAAHFTNNI
jgi:hypothetical protein